MVQKIKIQHLNQNANNPRLIKDTKFNQLVSSIKEFPEMLKIRPIVVDENNVVLGGNMRLRACKEAGLKEVWIEKVENFTEEQKKEFIIKDNVGFGEWEWDILANKWDNVQLKEWGMDVWQPTEENYEDFFEDKVDEIETNKIILEYTEEEYKLIIEKLAQLDGTKESIIFNLLTNINECTCK
tara:strand:+ start:6446 stop:6994 length:549 start_codon:yes stop_codon:yes gene_type:complete